MWSRSNAGRGGAEANGPPLLGHSRSWCEQLTPSSRSQPAPGRTGLTGAACACAPETCAAGSEEVRGTDRRARCAPPRRRHLRGRHPRSGLLGSAPQAGASASAPGLFGVRECGAGRGLSEPRLLGHWSRWPSAPKCFTNKRNAHRSGRSCSLLLALKGTALAVCSGQEPVSAGAGGSAQDLWGWVPAGGTPAAHCLPSADWDMALPRMAQADTAEHLTFLSVPVSA